MEKPTYTNFLTLPLHFENLDFAGITALAAVEGSGLTGLAAGAESACLGRRNVRIRDTGDRANKRRVPPSASCGLRIPLPTVRTRDCGPHRVGREMRASAQGGSRTFLPAELSERDIGKRRIREHLEGTKGNASRERRPLTNRRAKSYVAVLRAANRQTGAWRHCGFPVEARD